MKPLHLESIAKTRGFESLKAYLQDQYVTNRYSQEAIAAELEIGIKKLRELLDEYGIEKPDFKIPLTLREAKKMGPDAIAKAHGISRSKAWRWKQAVILKARTDEGS